MQSSFDLFRLDPGDSPIWVGSVNDLESAQRLIRQHAGEQRTRFLLWAQATQSKLFYEATKDDIVPVKVSREA
jgi:hypothetical protein